MSAIIYPTWKMRGSPTPNDTLWICDVCGAATWSQHTFERPPVCQCSNRPRLRRATVAEQAEGECHLVKVIG